MNDNSREMEGPPTRPLLIVVSAPSGAGKTTLCDRLVAQRPDLVYSVSCTTRKSRGEEVDGQDYHFITGQEFERRREAGDFLEHARVHGYAYGTLRSTVLEALAAGHSVLMDIDVQGAAQVRARVADAPEGDELRTAFVDIFIEPPSLAVLRERLQGRGEDSPAAIARRLRNAEQEIGRRGEFRYCIVNDDLQKAYAELQIILDCESCVASVEGPSAGMV